MIPWQLKFSGIRDYGPTLMNFDDDEHVIISGSNGSGKSTITFCFGAVLCSAKVDVAGLRPRNLPASETWHAEISLLLKNDGVHQIDAPLFVRFSLFIVQRPNEPIKKEYRVLAGHQLEELDQVATYRSGDPFYNFSRYKKDLRFKYKVDPDAFYSIWYQQEASQFAMMNPEERFRVFSEMYGIDKTKRDWELKAAQVKEAQRTLKTVEAELQLEQMEMDMMKNAVHRYEDHKKRLETNGTLYIQSLLHLENYYALSKQEQEHLVQSLTVQLESEESDLAIYRKEKGQLQEKLEQLKLGKIKIQEQMDLVQQQLKEDWKMVERLNERIDRLEKELESKEIDKNKLVMPQGKVERLLIETNEQLEAIMSEHAYETERYEERLQQWETLVQSIERVTVKIELASKEEKQSERLLATYKSSHQMKKQLKTLEIARQSEYYALNDVLQEQQILRQELELFKKREFLSKRQRQSLRFCRQNGIRAFPFQALLQLEESASIQDERKVNAIKYTIFFVGKHIEPPNDLYHVPLQKVVPERGITALTSLHLKIKEGLQDQHVAYAMKALWWVEQLFLGKDIQNGVLTDGYGLRGSEDAEAFFLNEKAYRRMENKVQRQLDKLVIEEKILLQKKEASARECDLLNSEFQKVEEAEAFMKGSNERLKQLRGLERLEKEKVLNEADRAQQLKQLDALRKRKVEQSARYEDLKKKLELYLQLGDSQTAIKELDKNKIEKAKRWKDVKERTRQLEKLEDKRRQQAEIIWMHHRKIEELSECLLRTQKTSKQLTEQKESTLGKLDQLKRERIEMRKTLTDLQREVPDLYDKVCAIEEVTPSSMTNIKHALEEAKVRFEHARREEGVDPAAPANYAAIQQNYTFKKERYQESKLLLEQYTERLKKLEGLLETTINTRVQTIQQKFRAYMKQFQLEGEIRWHRHIDRNDRVKFKLLIQIKKEGHEGARMDVGLPARGGKVGQGVSGGEESLGSLLFALALLRNLQTSPNFIILDEFDSALDEQRKGQVFDLYASELKRKLIILSPKSHESTYYDKFSRAFIVKHTDAIPQSEIIAIKKVKPAMHLTPSVH